MYFNKLFLLSYHFVTNLSNLPKITSLIHIEILKKFVYNEDILLKGAINLAERISEKQSTNSIVRQNLRLLREANGLSMKMVAEALGVKPNTYRVWEAEDGKSGIKNYRIVQLAKIYGVTTDFILTSRDEDPQPSVGDMLKVAAPNLYNKEIYGDNYLSELSDYEKILVMQVRRLNNTDKQKLNEYLGGILDDMDRLNAEEDED